MNYAAERYAAGIDLSDNQFKNKTYTLANGRGQITYTVTLVTGSFIPYYDVVSIGTVNDNDGMLLARAQVRSSSRPGTPNYFPYEPPANQTTIAITMNDLSGFKSQDLKDAANHPMVSIESYVATGGTHLYWAAFTTRGPIPAPMATTPAAPWGFTRPR